MLKIGITGGIGSGKTTVCRIFEYAFNIPVYYADDRAKWLMTEQTTVKSQIIDLLGSAAYQADGQLDRQYIAGQVFSNQQKLTALNNIVHPAVKADGLNWFEQQVTPYALKEAALLYESGSHQQLDKIIVVTAPESLRIERVMQRDGVNAEAVQARIAKQMPETEKVALADFVINNDGQQFLSHQVRAIHQQLLAIADQGGK